MSIHALKPLLAAALFTAAGFAQAEGPLLIAAGGPLPLAPGAPPMAETVLDKPVQLQATITSTRTLADGNEIVNTTQQQLLRRADGRTLMRLTPANAGPEIAMLRDPGARTTIHLFPADKTAMRMPERQGDPEGPRQVDILMHRGAGPGGPPPAPALLMSRPFPIGVGGPSGPGNQKWTTTALGSKKILGVDAVGTRMQMTIPAGAIGNKKDLVTQIDQWMASELKLPLQVVHSDPMMGRTEYQVTSLTAAEPDAAQFEVPAGYRWVEPFRHGPQGRPQK